MKSRIPSWPALWIWATFSAAIYVIGAGFAGSFVPEVPPTEYPVDFILWLATMVIVALPFALMVARLIPVQRHRDTDA